MAKQTICNKCGRVIYESLDTCDFSIHTVMGYCSNNEGRFLDLDLCPACGDDVIGELSARCKIPLLSDD